MKILLDTGVFSRSELIKLSSTEKTVKWGDIEVTTNILGFKRIDPDPDTERQNQIECIHTIGRLIRENKIQAFTYCEIEFERMRGRSREARYNALRGCEIKHCPPAIERSKFRKTLNLEAYIRKGGKKDIKKGLESSSFSQLPFLEWLSKLNTENIEALLKIFEDLHLTEHEITALKNISLFQEVAKNISKEDLVDLFHLWTAEQSDLDVFLTLDKRFQKKMLELNDKHEIHCKILTPKELLSEFKITTPDSIPVQYDKLYSYMDENIK